MAAGGGPPCRQLLDGPGDALLEIAACPELLVAVPDAVVLQLLAYHVALRAGQGRRRARKPAAKSVEPRRVTGSLLDPRLVPRPGPA